MTQKSPERPAGVMSGVPIWLPCQTSAKTGQLLTDCLLDLIYFVALIVPELGELRTCGGTTGRTERGTVKTHSGSVGRSLRVHGAYGEHFSDGGAEARRLPAAAC